MAKIYKRGDLVWGKIRGFPWWPAMILDPSDYGKKEECCRASYIVFLFGDHYITQIKKHNLKPFKEGFAEYKSSHREFVSALEEFLGVFSEINQLKLDCGQFLSWSEHNFESTFPVEFRWNYEELPKMIQDALILAKATSYKSDTEADLVRILLGRKLCLRDICIACGTGIYELTENLPNNLVFQHPFFFGSICLFCVSSIARVCYLPCDKVQDYCMVCGKQGFVVICSKEECSKAYCQDCIECFDCEKAFPEIEENNNWLCYFCKPSDNPFCLIQRKDFSDSREVYKPPPQYAAADNNNFSKWRSSEDWGDLYIVRVEDMETENEKM